jgi:uncharacterized membrane protein YjdF
MTIKKLFVINILNTKVVLYVLKGESQKVSLRDVWFSENDPIIIVIIALVFVAKR